MKGFFDSVPRYLEEAAWLDGRSKLRALFEIVLPVARPGIAVAAGLSFLSAWAEVLMVIILIDQQSKKTVPLAFYEAFRTAGGYTEVRYDLVAAMGVLYLLPVMLLFFATRRFMVRGLMGTTTLKLAGLRHTFQAVSLPYLQHPPERGETWMRFAQTTGGRTATGSVTSPMTGASA